MTRQGISYMYIATQENLAAFVERARSSSVLAIDTEFLREKTYYAKLCLLQMATDDEVVIVDPFEMDDLSVLAPLLADERIVKLFHAAGQDLEIILREVGVLPRPVFDTQIAAALLGHTQQIGYAALVHAECGVSLKKIDSFTDWSRRPLSASQRDYAADDVVYLPRLYAGMRAALEEKGRLHWLDHDFEELSDPARYEANERERFRRLKRVSQLSRRQLSAAREVAAWRELEAQRRDVPRKWVVTDEQIVEACKREARTIDELFMVRGLSDRLSTKDARAVVSLISSALSAPPGHVARARPLRQERAERGCGARPHERARAPARQGERHRVSHAGQPRRPRARRARLPRGRGPAARLAARHRGRGAAGAAGRPADAQPGRRAQGGAAGGSRRRVRPAGPRGPERRRAPGQAAPDEGLAAAGCGKITAR